jgi:hypothetical protein
MAARLTEKQSVLGAMLKELSTLPYGVVEISVGAMNLRDLYHFDRKIVEATRFAQKLEVKA